jgi:hypothetical protein
VRKLTYWIAQCLDDSSAYSIRRRTRREAQAAAKERDEGRYGPLRKVVVEFENVHELVFRALGEGRLDYEERRDQETES